MKNPRKTKTLLRTALLLLVGLATCLAPIETRASDSCYQSATMPQPSASRSYSSYVQVTWSAFAGCSPFGGRYVVYRSESSTFSWSTTKGIAVTTSTTYYDYSAVAGKTYWYWIGVVDNAGATWVNYDKKDYGIRTKDDCFATASLPQPLASISYSDYVKVTWPAFTGCSPFGGRYVVYRSESSTFSWSTARGLAVTTSTTYYDYSATAGKTYWYWIGVVDNAGSTWVNYDKKDCIACRRPANCFATASLPQPSASISYCDYVKVTWPAFTGCSPFGGKYVIYRSTSSTFSWSSVRGLAVTYGTTYYDYSAAAGTTYWYWVGVVDNAGATWVNYDKKDYGRKGWSSAPGPLPQPSVSLSYSGDYVKVTWPAFTGWGCSPFGGRYVVYRSESSTFSWSTTKGLAVTTTTTYYDYSVVAGKTYCYWIGVVDNAGSTWVNYDKKGCIDCRPANCFATASLPQPTTYSSSSYIKIEWPAFTGCSPFGGRYVVYRSESSTFSWSTVRGLAVTTSTDYYDYSAAAGTTYWYWVGVVDNAGATWVEPTKCDYNRLSR